MVDKSESQNNGDIGAEVTDSSAKLSPYAVLDAEAGGKGGDGEAPVPAPAAPTGFTVAGEKRLGGSGNVSHGEERESLQRVFTLRIPSTFGVLGGQLTVLVVIQDRQPTLEAPCTSDRLIYFKIRWHPFNICVLASNFVCTELKAYRTFNIHRTCYEKKLDEALFKTF